MIPPPKKALKFLRWFCREDYIEEIEGDLTEVFEKQCEASPTKARWKFTWSVIRYFRPEFIKSFKRNYPLNHSAMFRHNLLLTYRTFKRYKMSFFINLIGLSTGLACALLIYLWVNDEMSVDKFHEKDNQLFQALLNRHNTDRIDTERATPALLAETLAEEMPEVERAVATTSGMEVPLFTLSVQDKNMKGAVLFAGKDFFNMFSYGLVQGDENQVLADKSSIVLSKTLALKLFGTTNNIMGKPVVVQHDKQYLVSGIFEDVPFNSTDQFDFVLSFEVFKDLMGPGHRNWGNTVPSTFVLLRKDTDLNDFNAKVAGFIKSKDKDANVDVFLRPYSDKYLYNHYENGVQAGGRIAYVSLFSTIAIFILIIACINFMNLSTAKASRRLKEVGVKKAIGAGRKTLVFQYLGESMLMAFLSLLMAIIIVALLLPQFNQITGKQLTLSFDTNYILSILGIIFFTGLIAGSYPALYLSGFNPVVILKGKLNSSTGELWMRKGLVIFQFTLSVILIVGVMVVYKQIEYIQTKNLGYNKDNILYFEKEGKVAENMATFLSEVKNIPGIVNATSTTHTFTGHQQKTSDLQWEGKNPEDIISFEMAKVNYDIFETLGIEMAAGRGFSRDFSTDSAKIVFNEAAIDVMGIKDPVGKVVKLWGEDRQIIGVTKNFHFQSLHEEIKPFFFILVPEDTRHIMAKIEAGKERETIAQLQEFYQAFNPEFSFDYQFLDENYQTLYAAEQRVSTLSKYFAALAILISCLGLFGLAAFTAERRLKEIGIRKILGSSNFGIIRLLSADFTQMVLIAIVIALPISYFIAKNWLDDFAYRIDLSWWYFAGAGLVALFIAWFTVGLQTVKAARINPVECLKDE